MLGEYISLNGKLIKNEEAKISIGNIEFSYGFGVYETIRLRNNKVYFLNDHLERLINSAKIIGLEHKFSLAEINNWIKELVAKNNVESANIKMLLIGGTNPELYITLLSPLYPDKKIYRDGAKAITYVNERFLPGAKTLNMLPSYLAYKKAQAVGAFDALFIDHEGNITEGTRSNFFAIKNKTLFTAPVEAVLDGVTRRKVIECALANDFQIKEENIKLINIFDYDGVFVTNTSGKIVPLKIIDEESYPIISEEIKNLIKLFDVWIEK